MSENMGKYVHCEEGKDVLSNYDMGIIMIYIFILCFKMDDGPQTDVFDQNDVCKDVLE